MKLPMKIGVGFGFVIAITVALRVLANSNMLKGCSRRDMIPGFVELQLTLHLGVCHWAV